MTHSAGDVRNTPLSAEPDGFRPVMAIVYSLVVIGTAFARDRPHVATVTAFAVLSQSRPLVSVALDRNPLQLAQVRATGRLGVNVLAHDQAEIATRCSTKDLDKFEKVPWTEVDGLPRIAGTATWLACESWQELTLGDHVLVVTHVVAADSTDAVPAPPVFGQQAFGTHSVSVPTAVA